MNTIVGSFESFAEAHRAMEQLEQAGVPMHDVSLAGAGTLPPGAPAPLSDDGGGAATGAATGGALGGVAGLVAGIAGLTIPGLGAIFAAGPLLAALGGAATGAVAGGIIGGLIDHGIPEHEAHGYAEAVRRGATLVIARVDDEYAERARQILHDDHGVDLEQRMQDWRREGWSGRFDGSTRPH